VPSALFSQNRRGCCRIKGTGSTLAPRRHNIRALPLWVSMQQQSVWAEWNRLRTDIPRHVSPPSPSDVVFLGHPDDVGVMTYSTRPDRFPAASRVFAGLVLPPPFKFTSLLFGEGRGRRPRPVAVRPVHSSRQPFQLDQRRPAAAGRAKMCCPTTKTQTKTVRSFEMKLKLNWNRTVSLPIHNCFETVLFQFCFSFVSVSFHLCGQFYMSLRDDVHLL